ncbi:MAG: PKD domain-containing protein [Euryarchaeota archaeon]|nr:PKD domain-containing protein [Euryarchaeota archaeon]
MARSKPVVLLFVALVTFAGCLDNKGAQTRAASSSPPPTETDEAPPSAEPVASEAPPSESPEPEPPADPENETEPEAPPAPPAPVATASVTSPSSSFAQYESDVYFEVKSPLVLDGGASTGEALGYAWDLGDGRTGAGRKVEATYLLFGDYTVTLRVTDTLGRNASTELFLHAAPPVAPEGDIVVRKGFTGSWSAHLDPTTQQPLIVSHEFPLPFGTKRLDIRVTWDVGPAHGDEASVTDVELGVFNVTGGRVVNAHGPGPIHATITAATALVPGYWRLELTPLRAPATSYRVDVLAWTVEPLTATFRGEFKDQDSPAAVAHELVTPGRVATLFAQLAWDGPDDGTIACQPADALASPLSVVAAPSSTPGKDYSSDDPASCEDILEDKDAGQALSDGGKWTFTVAAEPKAVGTTYVLTVLYA